MLQTTAVTTGATWFSAPTKQFIHKIDRYNDYTTNQNQTMYYALPVSGLKIRNPNPIWPAFGRQFTTGKML